MSNNKPTVTEIESEYADNMIFTILQANDGSIWFGADGVYRYDGNTIIDSDGKEVGNMGSTNGPYFGNSYYFDWGKFK